MSNSNLPALADLVSGDIAISEENKLNVLLNQPPPDHWIKTHPMHKEVRYLTIARIEYLLTSIFVEWDIEIKQVQLIANSVVVTVRIHYKDPITKSMRWTDGVGAADIQTKQGAGATDFAQINHSAVMKAAPAAKSFAVKDAAHKLGNMFGADLNRKDEIQYDAMLNNYQIKSAIDALKDELSEQIKSCQDEKVQANVMNEAFEAEGKENEEELLLKLLKDTFNYEPTK